MMSLVLEQIEFIYSPIFMQVRTLRHSFIYCENMHENV